MKLIVQRRYRFYWHDFRSKFHEHLSVESEFVARGQRLGFDNTTSLFPFINNESRPKAIKYICRCNANQLSGCDLWTSEKLQSSHSHGVVGQSTTVFANLYLKMLHYTTKRFTKIFLCFRNSLYNSLMFKSVNTQSNVLSVLSDFVYVTRYFPLLNVIHPKV
jgi:hypothetical protein